MDVSVIGAGGTIGRQIAISLVEQRVLPSTARLQLVGRRGGRSSHLVHGLAADLSDAYAESLPEIDVALEPDDVLGDIVIVAAGRAASTDPREAVDRAHLARDNAEAFEAYARAIEKNGHGEEIILIVTNPVELGVHVFSRHHPRRRVIGMGAFLDTLRFRREIAAELGIRRQAVQGLVLGEHGLGLVPCFSTVSAYGFDSEEGRAKIARLERATDPEPAEALREIADVVRRFGPAHAYRHAARYGAGLRTLLKPYITHFSGAKTPVGTAEIIARLVETIVSGDQTLAAAQLLLEGEFLDIEGVTGAPAMLCNRGVSRIEPVELLAPEADRVRAAARKVSTYLTRMGLA